MIFENTQEPIIDREKFFKVQQLLDSRKKTPKDATTDIFAGYVFCNDCGRRLYRNASPSLLVSRNKAFYACGGYGKKYNKVPNCYNCSLHYITESVLHRIVLDKINEVIELSKYDYEHFLNVIMKSIEKKCDSSVSTAKKEILQYDSRITELDNIIKKLFEQLAVGNLSDERFRILSHEYEVEQTALRKKSNSLKEQIEAFSSQSKDINRFVDIVKRYSHIEELTPIILSEFIDKVCVYEAEKDENGKRIQQVDVYFNCMGVLQNDD